MRSILKFGVPMVAAALALSACGGTSDGSGSTNADSGKKNCSQKIAFFGALMFTFLRIPDPNTPFFTTGWTTTLNIYAQVGLVTLVGLIAKNGILVVEFANTLQEEGRSKLEAVHEAAMTRLRPVLMTSVATIAGHLPLTLVSGPGAGPAATAAGILNDIYSL